MGDANFLERILDGAEDPTNLSLAMLQDITDNFSEERKIGQGGFGAVYKGVLGQRTVAVKRININENTVDDRLFRGELASLWNTNNRNVVRILGVCSEEHHKPMKVDGEGELIWANVLERLLCFEYIRNGSLDKHTTDELRGFEWETRYEIITGICKGLRYLHEEKKIIHMDLKPANILLHHQDEKYMVPKITDFGLSRPNEKSHTMGKRYGTLGYMAPEYRERGETTRECDIYSLGAIIIELVTGCKDVPYKDKVLRKWRHRWKKPPTQLQYQQVTRCIDIAGRCRKQDPKQRPSISKIISFLGESESTHGQISPLLDEDDMLGIKPLELRLPFDLNNEITRSIELTNGTRKCIAFNIQLPNPERYSAQPVKGIMRPGSKYDVKITVQERDVHRHDHADKFIVQSMEVSEGLGEEITERISVADPCKVVDDVDLMVVYEPKKPLKNSRSREDTNMPTEEIHEAKKRKTGESSSGHGKCKLGSSENVEEASKDISSSTQGQYTKQLDRCNFHPLENFPHNQATNMTYLVRDSDRVMDVTRGAMGSLLHKLGVLGKEFNLKTSIEKDADELVNMQQVLRKVSDVQQENQLVKRWASNVREMSYDLEDFVDGFLENSEPVSNSGSSRELIHEMSFPLEKGRSHRSMGDLIKHHISKRVQDAAKKCKDCKADNFVPDATTKANIKDRRLSALYEDKELIGIETPREEIIRLVKEDENVPKEKLRVVSIVGMGGLGKTTLANAVFKNLKAEYDHKTLVSVGQNPDVENVLTKIIRKLNKNSRGVKCDMDELIGELQEFLEDKRYLIVIDDIWDSKAWDLISSAFPRNNHGSRVITTTRIDDVALACCNFESKYIYKIQQLGKEDSRKLFFGRIFGPGKDCLDAHESISIDILKKCGGMPLAINSIASLLVGQPRSTWDYVRRTLGAIVEENPKIGNVKQILDLSYIHLPDHLKTCLLYICKYQEDEEIDKNDLLRQWVAEGFVVSKNGRLDAEDVAEKYFKALINMCMIQPEEIDYNDEVLSCRVHDIILELIRSKSSEENFVHVVDGSKDMTGALCQIRRVSVHCNYKEDFLSQCSHVRSVCLYGVPRLVPYFQVFKYIRVLHLKAIMSLDLNGISRLFLLRYFRIEGYNIRGKLPDQIEELQQLETLDLEGFQVDKLPSDIVSLPRLSHLICNSRGVVLPEGIGRLKSLRTLRGVDVFGSSVENIKGIGELTNLRNLKIYLSVPEDEIAAEALHSSISRLSNSLRNLTFNGIYALDAQIWRRPLFPRGSCIGELNLWYCSFQKCPAWIGQLHDLYSLTIRVVEVADAVSMVAALPSLAYFSLGIPLTATEEQRSVVIKGSRAFQALKYLDFMCPETSLTFELGALPKLEKLSVLITRRVVPVGLEHLPAPARKEIYFTMGYRQHEWKVKGAEHWNDLEWIRYWSSYYYTADEGASREKGSQTTAQVQPNTRQVGLTEAHEDCGRMSSNTGAPPRSPHIAVGSEGRQGGPTQYLESLQPHCTRLPFHIQPRLELSGQAPDWKSSGNLRLFWKSCLELTKPWSELSSQVQDSESSQLPSTSLPSSIQLTQPRSELNQAPNELNDEDFLWIDEAFIELMKRQAPNS